jgi:hypothetical protein
MWHFHYPAQGLNYDFSGKGVNSFITCCSIITAVQKMSFSGVVVWSVYEPENQLNFQASSIFKVYDFAAKSFSWITITGLSV